jgi:zinc transporter 1/2/3
MDNAREVARLVARQVTEAPDDLIGTPGHCDGSNEYDGRLGLRVSAIFVILTGSMLG